MGGWKQKSGWIQILPDSPVPFTFPFLSQSQLSVGLATQHLPFLRYMLKFVWKFNIGICMVVGFVIM